MDYFYDLKNTVKQALAEDVGTCDLTAELVEETTKATAKVIAKEPAVLCGKVWAEETIFQVDPEIRTEWQFEDGEQVASGEILVTLDGKARSILTAERTMLNFMQFLSAVATKTRNLVEKIKHTNSQLLDTRKTIPGLRLAQKYAVKIGGGQNHRIGLFDAFLIKENHIKAAGGISNAIEKAKKVNNSARIEIEVETVDELKEALECEPDWILLDNFSISDMMRAVEIARQKVKLEASGGIGDINSLLEIAKTGVDFISMGDLTKNIQAIDMSLLLD
ncbi:MAG: nicotinate-nucleotide diphosphorylase (carboxylating) [Gammaproteobacteria bacterium]|nr:nicotinate-nucleotide diphosphorylase (carboxylating) [Gammaproteobacteria bacterium]